MIKYLIALLLVTATVQQETFLSPPIPPTAFYQQYYQVIFRVRGLNGPTFTFENLPNFFVGTAEGVVSGTPNITGTFRVGVSYTDGTTSGSSRVVISVTASANTDASAQQSAEVTALVIQNALNSWIYRTGDDVSIQLACSGTGSITWDYKGLPKGLSGDSNGKITGKIADSGLYSFSASAGDSEGRTTQAYYTLNIQPGTVIKSIFESIQPTLFFPSLTEASQLFIASNKSLHNKPLLELQLLPLLRVSLKLKELLKVFKLFEQKPKHLLILLSLKQMLLKLPSEKLKVSTVNH